MRSAGCGPGRGSPPSQPGLAQVRREFPAAVLGGVAGQGDRVPADLTRALDAEPLTHQADKDTQNQLTCIQPSLEPARA
jgi:hypothetical protein